MIKILALVPPVLVILCTFAVAVRDRARLNRYGINGDRRAWATCEIVAQCTLLMVQVTFLVRICLLQTWLSEWHIIQLTTYSIMIESWLIGGAGAFVLLVRHRRHRMDRVLGEMTGGESSGEPATKAAP